MQARRAAGSSLKKVRRDKLKAAKQQAITVHELTSRVRHQSSQLGKMSKQHADDKDGFLKRIHQLETELKRLKGQLDEARARNVLLQAQVLAGSGQQGYELLRIDEAWSPALDENANEMDAQTKTAITPMAGFSRRLSVARTRTIEAVAQLMHVDVVGLIERLPSRFQHEWADVAHASMSELGRVAAGLARILDIVKRVQNKSDPATVVHLLSEGAHAEQRLEGGAGRKLVEIYPM